MKDLVYFRAFEEDDPDFKDKVYKMINSKFHYNEKYDDHELLIAGINLKSGAVVVFKNNDVTFLPKFVPEK